MVLAIVSLAVGIAIGCFIGALIKPERPIGQNPDYQVLDAKVRSLQIETAKKDVQIQGLGSQLAEVEVSLESKTTELQTIREALTKAVSIRESAELRIKEQRAEFDNVREQLKTDFANLANAILEEKTSKFTKQNAENIATILKPLQEKLGDFRNRIEQTHEVTLKDGASLREQIKLLAEQSVVMSKEASNLTNALKGQNKIAGNWGELVLERLLESSGLTRGTEYLVQESFTADDGSRLQPDVIINLPEKKHLVVDSKVSLVSYERFCNCVDENDGAEHLNAHIASLRSHINGLSGKRYQDLYQINTPDFVILFVPIDAALITILQADPKVYTDAFEKGICLTSPTTLLFSLRTIANLWRRQKQETNAIEIAKRGGALYDKFVAFFMKLQALGDAINKAHNHYEDAMSQLKNGKGSLVRQAEMMRELGARTSKQLPVEVLPELEQEQVA